MRVMLGLSGVPGGLLPEVAVFFVKLVLTVFGFSVVKCTLQFPYQNEGQSIGTPITEIINQKLIYLLFRMRVVQLVDALAFFPAVNPDIPIVAS